MRHARRAVLIAGPTASGKSALALALAAEFGGIVVNADAMQVYGDLRVLTARPSPAEEARAPHRLYGHVDAAAPYSVAAWLADAAAALAQTRLQGRLPIFVGGTGLYFKLLLGGIATLPPLSAELRAHWRARLLAEGAMKLHAELCGRDPAAAARIAPRDGVRIVRALEVLEATGRSITRWQAENGPPLRAARHAAAVFLAPDRTALQRRIDARFDAMLAEGALAEARILAARGLDPRAPAMKAHGVPWLVRHAAGEISLDEAAAGAKADTRRYAKRQFTWFRNQLPRWPALEPDRALAALREELRAGA